MERSFTQQDIDRFLSDFRNLSNPYKIEKVHQLLNNPHARARYTVKSNYKPINFLIMTGIIITGLSALLIWSNPKKANINEFGTSEDFGVDKEIVMDSNYSAKKTTDLNEHDIDSPTIKTKVFPKSEVTKEPRLHKEVPSVLDKSKVEDSTIKTRVMLNNNINKPVQSVTEKEPKVYNALPEYKTESCVWSPDTIIDKKRLLVELSDKELKTIGVARSGQATFYHNIIAGRYDMALTSHPELITEEEKITTFNKFFVAYTTNSQFEPAGSGNFYSSMDTLVPVIINNQAGQIFWFTPHESFFNLLPERYSYLRNVYKNLICLKKKYPERTFTNYLGSGIERILDPINVLNLKKEELQKIGIQINDECLIFQTKNKKYSLKICKTGTYSIGNDEDFYIFPPNPYPVLMTDTLGRRFYVVNSMTNTDSLSKVMNIFVPVRINLNEIIHNNHEVIICWYYPTQEFLNSLPKTIGAEIESEINNITNESKISSTACNYFEVCKSSLKLDNFKLYPNPARSYVTIEFENPEEFIGSISIINMAGLRLRELLPNSTFLSGHNSYQMSLSGINPGIYLISVNTTRGFKTQRLIVTQ